MLVPSFSCNDKNWTMVGSRSLLEICFGSTLNDQSTDRKSSMILCWEPTALRCFWWQLRLVGILLLCFARTLLIKSQVWLHTGGKSNGTSSCFLMLVGVPIRLGPSWPSPRIASRPTRFSSTEVPSTGRNLDLTPEDCLHISSPYFPTWGSLGHDFIWLHSLSLRNPPSCQPPSPSHLLLLCASSPAGPFRTQLQQLSEISKRGVPSGLNCNLQNVCQRKCPNKG